MKHLIKKILREELLTEASGTFNKSMAVEITDNVLAYPEGKTEKTYDYLGVVKGEAAVGRLHFTTSGLDLLYDMMGDKITQKYFDGKSVKDLQNFSEQKDGKEYKHDWWMDGMREFLSSKDSKPVQDETIYQKFSRKFNRSKYGNVLTKWSTPREFAIGMAAQNSANLCLLRGRNADWDAEELMKDYCKGRDNGGCPSTGGCRTRCRNINDFYPAPKDKEGYVWSKDEYKKYC